MLETYFGSPKMVAHLRAGPSGPYLDGPDDTACAEDGEPAPASYTCPCCGGRMIVIETFERGCTPRHHPTQRIRIDSS